MLQFDWVTIFLIPVTAILVAVFLHKNKSPDIPIPRIYAQSDTGRSRNQGETAEYRSRMLYMGYKTNYFAEVTTLPLLFDQALKFQGKLFGSKVSNEFVYQSIEDVNRRRKNLASGFAELELEATNQTRIGLMLPNCADWMIVEMACHYNSMVSVAIPPDVTSTQLIAIIEETKLSAIVVEDVSTVAGLRSDLIVIKRGRLSDEERSKFSLSGQKIFSLAEIEEMGQKTEIAPNYPTKKEKDDKLLACINYTAGVTGNPKAVELTHDALIASISSVFFHFGMPSVFSKDDIYFCHLPLSLLPERVFVYCLLAVGAKVAFSNEQGLKVFEDAAKVKPTVISGSANTFIELYKQFLRRSSQLSGLGKLQHHFAMKQRDKELSRGIMPRGAFYDSSVLADCRRGAFSNIRLFFVAYDSLPSVVSRTLRLIHLCNVIETYGLTETSGLVTMTIAGDYTTGHLGAPHSCNKVKLIDTPELGFFADDGDSPKGEILVTGPTNCLGYTSDPNLTAESIKENWFHTGDIGEWTTRGTLRVLGRKAHMIKLASGAHVSADKIQTSARLSSFVQDVVVSSDRIPAKIRALVVPDEEVLLSWAKAHGMPSTMSELTQRPEVVALIKADIDRVCKEQSHPELDFDIVVELVAGIDSGTRRRVA